MRAKYAGSESRVKPTDTVKDRHAYVSLWNQSYDRRGTSPEGKTVKEALEIVAEKKAKKGLLQTTAISDDVPPGQMSIFDEDEENERPFDEPSEEPQEETEDDFGEQEFVQGGGIDEDVEKKKEYSAPTIEIEENVATIKDLLSFKSAFRDCAKEFCEKFDYTIELCGRKQGAWAFAGVLFEHMKAKGLFKC